MFTCLMLLGFVEYVFVNCFVFSVSGCYCFLSVFKYLFLKGTAFKLRMYAERESLMIVLEKKKHSRKKENPF